MNWCLGSTPNIRLIGILWFNWRQLEIDWLKEKMGFQYLNFLEVLIFFVLYQIFHRQLDFVSWTCEHVLWESLCSHGYYYYYYYFKYGTLWRYGTSFMCFFFFFYMSTVKCSWKYIMSSSCNNIGPYLKLYFHKK